MSVPVLYVSGMAMDPRDMSSKVVEQLTKLDLEKKLNVKLVTADLSQGDGLKAEIENMWATHKPQLVVHLGSVNKEEFVLDLGALDSEGGTIKSTLDVANIVKEYNDQQPAIKATTADFSERGQACSEVFNISLNINSARTVFVHVPADGDVNALASGVVNIIEIAFPLTN